MAAFLERAGSRVELNNQSGSQNFGVGTSNNFSPRQQLTQVTVDAPDLTGCSQWALVQGRANLFTNSTSINACHVTQACNGHLWLEHGGSDIGGGFQRLNTDFSGGSVTVQGLVPLVGGTGAQTFSLTASGFNVKEGEGLANGGVLSVTIVPFS
jgi:hypothetical protein